MQITGADGNSQNNNYSVSVNYQIREGDTLETISKASGIPVPILAKDNNIKDANKINEGETIFLRYHPADWEAFNSPEMNEMFPNMNDQARYFDQIDAEETARYNKIAQEGAQQYVKHLNTKG